MRVLSSVVRLLLTTLALLTATAIVLGRYAPRPADHRQLELPRYRLIGDHGPRNAGTGLRLLDLASGAIEQVELADTERVDFAACSPWRDGQGRSHVAGFWTNSGGSQAHQTGLARYAVPGGELLDQVVLDIVPGGPLCWFPGTSAKVLFSGWDGQLYSYLFDDPPRGHEPHGLGTRKPVALAWRNPPPWKESRLFWEPIWPIDPRLGGKVIVTLSFNEPGQDEERRPRCQTQLWWLRLNHDGTVIEDQGRLIAPGTGHPVVEERWASLAATPDGGLALAYLTRREENSELRMRLAPVTIDPASGRPSVDEQDVVEFPEPRLPRPPEFSADGRWVYSLSSEAQGGDGVERFSVAAALTGRPEPVAQSAPAPTGPAVATAARVIRDRVLARPAPLMVNPGRLRKS